MSSEAEKQTEMIALLAGGYVFALRRNAEAKGDHMAERLAGIQGIENVLRYFIDYARTGRVGPVMDTVKAGNNPASTGELEIAITRPEAEAPQADAPSRSAPSD